MTEAQVTALMAVQQDIMDLLAMMYAQKAALTPAVNKQMDFAMAVNQAGLDRNAVWVRFISFQFRLKLTNCFTSY